MLPPTQAAGLLTPQGHFSPADTGEKRQSHRESAGIAPSTTLRTGSGRAGETVLFGCFGGEAAKTTE
jgi:hypothetical protein